MPYALVRGHFCSKSGYGYVTESVLVALKTMGVDVTPVADSIGAPPREMVRSEFEKVRPSRTWRSYIHCQLPMFRNETGGRRMMYTMWEQTRLHPDWVANLNTCEVVVVPCRANEVLFAACGVVVPIEVVPLGIPRVGESEGGESKETIYGTGGSGPRKHLERVVEAFKLAFPSDPSVRLMVKTGRDHGLRDTRDSRITVDTRDLEEEEFNAWLRGISCYVSASSGEGFGLFPSKAMAVGKPVIGAQFMGQADYLDDFVGVVVPHTLVPFEHGGCVASVRVEDLACAMREIRPQLRIKGARSRERMELFSSAVFARKLYRVAVNYGIIEE